MTLGKRLLAIVPLCLLLAAGTIPQSQGDTLVVTKKETRLRSGKRLFAPGVADLKEGDKLAFQSRDGVWLEAKFKDVTGWLHETDVSARTEVRLSGEGVRESYSASEAAAARKGFNPQVERQYRQGNPNLEAAFKLVDKIQAGKIPEAEEREFLISGGLLKEGR